jgi:hypothetical protein
VYAEHGYVQSGRLHVTSSYKLGYAGAPPSLPVLLCSPLKASFDCRRVTKPLPKGHTRLGFYVRHQA